MVETQLNTGSDANTGHEVVDRVREAEHPQSPVVRFGADRPLQLDAGVSLSPVQIAYQTYGTLNAERSNAVLICHALTGDQHVANIHPVTGKPGWWETLVGPGPADRHRALFRDLPECARRLHGHDRPGLDQSGDRPGLGPRFSGDHDPRHGARPGHAARPSRHRHPVLRSPAARWAGCRCCNGPSSYPERVFAALPIAARDAAFGPEHRLPRGRPPGGHGRSGMAAADAISTEGAQPAPRPRGGAHGRAYHLSVGRGAAPQIRPQIPGPRQADLLLRRRFPGRELSAPPGLDLRRALRRQFLSLSHAGDGLFRSRGRLRRRRSRAHSKAPRRASA